jgi:RNase P protein component
MEITRLGHNFGKIHEQAVARFEIRRFAKDGVTLRAAPELLEALQFVMTASGEQLSTAFEQAQAAIAKATGETP